MPSFTIDSCPRSKKEMKKIENFFGLRFRELGDAIKVSWVPCFILP
jgi:hypothetical protein